MISIISLDLMFRLRTAKDQDKTIVYGTVCIDRDANLEASRPSAEPIGRTRGSGTTGRPGQPMPGITGVL